MSQMCITACTKFKSNIDRILNATDQRTSVRVLPNEWSGNRTMFLSASMDLENAGHLQENKSKLLPINGQPATRIEFVFCQKQIRPTAEASVFAACDKMLVVFASEWRLT